MWRKDSGYVSIIGVEAGQASAGETPQRSPPNTSSEEGPSEPAATRNRSEWAAPPNFAHESGTPPQELFAFDDDVDAEVEDNALYEVNSNCAAEEMLRQRLIPEVVDLELERRYVCVCNGLSPHDERDCRYR